MSAHDHLSPQQFDMPNPLAAKSTLPDWHHLTYGDDTVSSVPLDRLESRQPMVSPARVSGADTRRPVEVVHHVEEDRYELWDGNHRAVRALQEGQTHIPALLHEQVTSRRP